MTKLREEDPSDIPILVIVRKALVAIIDQS